MNKVIYAGWALCFVCSLCIGKLVDAHEHPWGAIGLILVVCFAIMGVTTWIIWQAGNTDE